MKFIKPKKQTLTAFHRVLLLNFLSLCLYGCGQGYQSQSSSEIQNFQSSNEDLRHYLNTINAFAYNQRTGQPALKEEEEAEGGLVRFYADLDVRFAPVANGIGSAHKAAKEQIWKDCRNEGHVDLNKEYKCGEVPTGKIISRNLKEIMVVPQEGVSGEQNGIEYTVDAVKIPIYMSRHQTSGQGKIRLLDKRSVQNVDIGYGLIDTIFFRLKPNAGTLETEICFFLPGLKVDAEVASTRVKAKKKVLWGLTRLKAEADIRVDFGQMSFDSGEFCAIFYAKTDENWQTKLEFERLKAPQLKNLRYKGLKVDVNVKPKGILKIITNILKIVGIHLEKKAEKMAREQLKKSIKDEAVEILNGDIKSGKWFYKQVNAEALLKEALPKVEAQINRAFKYLGPSSENYLQTKFRRACEKLADNLSLNSVSEFINFCKINIRIKSHLFLKDRDSEELGCYSHFFRPSVRNELRDKWWARGCKIRNKIEIVATEEFAPLYHCVSNVLNDTNDDNFNVGSCEYELKLLIEATKKFKIPTAVLLESFEDRIKKDPNFKKWEEMITTQSL